jgi:predicted deacetylase
MKIDDTSRAFIIIIVDVACCVQTDCEEVVEIIN